MRAILTFHTVESNGSVLSISAQGLRTLLATILGSGHQIVPLRTLLGGGCSNDDAVALTFDDGALSVAEQAAPILRDFGTSATLFLTTGFVGSRNTWPSQPAAAPQFPILGWNQVESLQASGWSIESHTISHPDLRRLDDATLERELTLPAEAIERRLGCRPRILAYPYGYFNARVVSMARRHYSHAVTTQFRCLGRDVDAHRIPRIDAYYLRSRLIHRHFGNSISFAAYLRAVSWLRRLRRHPGEQGSAG